MKYLLSIILIFTCIPVDGQISFINQITGYNIFANASTVDACNDGGTFMASFGVNPPAYCAGYVVKLDSNGVMEWTKQYGSFPDYVKSVDIRPTSDSGFYFMMYPWDAMFSQYTLIKILKCDKYGNITSAITTNWPTYPGGDFAYFTKSEKLTDNVYAIVAKYSKSPVGNPGEPAYYFLKIDTALNVLSLPLTCLAFTKPQITIEEIYLSNFPSGFLIGGTKKNSVQTVTLSMIDTIGGVVWERTYSTTGYSPKIKSILQKDSSFFILEQSSFNLLGFRKIDFLGNTLFYNEIQMSPVSPMQFATDMNYDELGNILITGYFTKIFNGFAYPFLTKLDTLGAIISSIEGIDSSGRVSSKIIANTGGAIMESGTWSVADTSRIIRTSILNTTCGFLPSVSNSNAIAYMDSSISGVAPSQLTAFYNDIILTASLTPGNNVLCVFTNNAKGHSEDIVEFDYYPNPVTDDLYMKIESESQHEVEIFNTYGSVVLRTFFVKSKKLNVSFFKSGLYTIIIKNKTGYMKSCKLIKL